MALLAVTLWLGGRGFLVFPHTPMKHVQAQPSSSSIKLVEATPKVLPDEVWIAVEEGQWSGRTSVFRGKIRQTRNSVILPNKNSIP